MLKNWEKNRLIIRASSSLLVLFLFSLVAYPNFLPGRSFAEPGVIANPSISITPSTNANISLYPGMFGTATQTISATTTNYTGYVLTFSTEGASTSLVNTEDDTITIPTITLPSGRTSITSSGFASNTYGYSLNGTDFKPVPAVNEELTLISTDSANVSADTRTLTFGAIVDTTVAPGTFINTFDLSATANEVGYLISYVANAGSDEVSGMPVPNPEPEPTSGLEVTLSDAVPERDGYRFIGWAETSNASMPDYEPSDTYLLDPETSNITTLYAVWKKLYAIIYDGNGADGGSMAMVTHENVAEGQTVDLYASNYNRDGYGFLGWSFDEDAAETLGTANESVIYGPNEEIIAPEYGEDEIIIGDTLVRYIYAIWLESSGTIQDWAGCGAMTTGSVVALTDNRDNNTYAVSKLGDGNCWMMENMRLSPDTANITKYNTNNPTDYFLSLNGQASTSWSTWGSSYWGFKYNNDNINRSKTPSPTNNDDNSSWYSYGVYYSWSTAMAGNDTELAGDLCPSGWRFPTQSEIESFVANQVPGTTQEKPQNILKYPINYILSGSYSSFGSETPWPYSFYIQSRGRASQYAVSDSASTNTNEAGDLSMFISRTNINVSNGYAYKGRAIKCRTRELVAGTVTYDANGGTGAPEPTTSAPATSHFTFSISSTAPTRSGYTFSGWTDQEGNEALPGSTFVTINPSSTFYAIWINNSCNTNATTIDTGNSATDAVCLQDMNQAVKSSMTSKNTYSLKDARDNKEYTISLLDDGNVWMTQNLEIGNGTSNIFLNQYDSDISSDDIPFLLSTSNYFTSENHGNYYDWVTSVAGADTVYSSSAVYPSICPAGWNLPTSAQYNSLKTAANFSTNNPPSSTPYNFNETGGFYNGDSLLNENYGYYWASVSYSKAIAYGINVVNSTFSVSTSSGPNYTAGAGKSNRRNLRCMAGKGYVTVHYYGNGSVNYPVEEPSSVDRTVSYDDASVSNIQFVRNHYTFKNWNTNANGTGTTVSSGTKVSTLSQPINLYAQWTPNLTVAYHSNDANQLTREFDVASGKSWTAFSQSTFTGLSPNIKISSWNTEPDGSGTTYNTSKSYTAPSNMATPDTLDLYAQWVQTYTIAYNGNSATGGTMEGFQNELVGIGDKVNLIAPNYYKTGYGFAGWSLSSNAVVNSNYTIYGPNEQIEITSDFLSHNVSGVITLYAVWVASSGTLQTFDTDDYQNSPTGTVLALRDERDNNIYAVAKQADGSWWMIENLRLRLASYGQTNNGKTIVGAKSITNGTVNEITTYNTSHPAQSFLITDNFSEDWKLIGQTGGYSTATLKVPEVEQINIGIGNINADNSPTPTGISVIGRGPHQDEYWYSYGVMYNWFAATAGNGVWDAGPSGSNTVGSICPSGWRIPTGSSNSDITSLASSVTSLTAFPTNFVKSGLYETGPSGIGTTPGAPYPASRERGESVYYWTSTNGTASANTSSNAYYITGLTTATSQSGLKVYGIAVRCIANTPTEYTIEFNANGGENAPNTQSVINNTGLFEHITNTTPTRSGYQFKGWIDADGVRVSPNDEYYSTHQSITFYAIWESIICNPDASTIGTNNSATDAVCLQDMNVTVKNNMTSKETYNLIDSRDNKTYTVSLLDDGNVWMTKNLALGDSEELLLTADDTDLADNSIFIMPSSNETFVTGANAYTTIQMMTDTTYGNYYSWAAAIADSSSHVSQGTTVTTSICPANWNLPTPGQYTNLANNARLTNVSHAIAEPYSFVKNGYRNGSNFSNQGNHIYLWTSTLPSSYNANYNSSAFYSYSSGISITNLYKYYGAAVRCILSNGTITVHYEKNGSEAYPVSGTPKDQIDVEIDYAKALANSSPNYMTRTNFSFNGWNTEPDGSGLSIPTNSLFADYGFEDGDEITLYAQWTPGLIIKYHSNNSNDITNTSTYYSNNWTTYGSSAFTSVNGNEKITSWNTKPDGSGTSYNVNTQYPKPAITEPTTIELYAQWSPTYTFTYDGNSADEGVMTNVIHTNVSAGDYLDLYASNYSKANYGFAGWSFDSNATVNSNSVIYGPNEKILITNSIISNYDNNGTITLYAVWVAPSGTMQGFSCADLSDSEVVALTDTRDKDVYTVTKYVDSTTGYSNCWMMENLRLDNTYTENNTSIAVVIDANNTQGIGGVFSTLADPETANFSSVTTANSLYSTSNITGSNQAHRFPRYNNTNTANRASNPQATDNRAGTSTVALNSTIYSYGNYYSWPAAIADTTYYYNSSNYVDITTSSICPKGWHLPTGGNNGEYTILTTANNNIKVLNYPLNFVKSGMYSGSATQSNGTTGTYWSSTTYTTATSSRGFSIAANQTTTINSFYRYSGYTVRCIADDPVEPEPDPESAAPDTEETTDDTIIDTDQEADEKVEDDKETETVEEEPEETSKETETDTQNDELENEDQ